MSDVAEPQILNTKSVSIMNLIAFRCGYYRHNIHRFAKDYLLLDLKLFQQILLWAMNEFDAFYFVAARSAGKTFLIAVYSVCRALLWPRTKIVVASYSYKQGREVVKKIRDELLIRSPLLRNEIEKISDGQNDCCVYFKSGSIIRVVVAGESGRGRKRSCVPLCLVIDSHIKSGEKSGKLKCQSEWKAVFKSMVTRRA